MSKLQLIICLLFSVFCFQITLGQSEEKPSLNIDTLNIHNIKQLKESDLIDMPLEDLMKIVSKLKLSSLKELYDLLVDPTVQSASKMEEKTFSSPLTISVISDKEIINSGATSIPEALRLAPGLIVREKTNGTYDVHIRGNNNVPPGKKLFFSENTISLVMIDEQPVYNNFRGGTFWESLPINLEDIKKIEIISGPTSALYGPNAVSGVIHIFTKNPEKKFHTNASAAVGTKGDRNANVSVDLPITKKLISRFSFGFDQKNRFEDTYVYFKDYQKYSADYIYRIDPQIKEQFPDPDIATQSWNFNTTLKYQISKNADISLWYATQRSRIQTIYLDINDFSLTTRESNTSYLDLKSNIGKLHTQLSYNSGVIDNSKGILGYKFAVDNLHLQTEYEFNPLKNLSFTPGIYYSSSIFRDNEFLPDEFKDQGLFNGSPSMNNFRFFIRSNYYLLQRKLRISAALSYDKYSIPNQPYLSHIISASYLINNENMVRLVHSKANRGPFMYDFNVNLFNERELPNGYEYVTRLVPNQDLKLETMRMLELGIRNKISKSIQTDLSVFYLRTYNFSDLFYTKDTIGNTINYTEKKENIDTKSHQVGLTLQINAVPSSKFQISAFGTLQLTVLEDFIANYYFEEDNSYYESTIITDLIHKSTPNFFGGINTNFTPKEKWNINGSLYYCSKQDFYSIDGITRIPGKVTCNLKTIYKAHKNAQIYLNIRNILNENKPEFVFADKTGISILVGTQIKL